MNRIFSIGAAMLLMVGAAAAQKNPMVGGAPMAPNHTIVQNASKANNLTTLVTAVKAAGLVDTLSGSGPFTVFAPTNEAFDKLPAGTVDNLLKPENKDQLKKILTYHVAPGKLDSKVLMRRIKAGHGSAELTTVEGEKLTVMSDDGKSIQVKDSKGDIANVTIPNVYQSNGVVHVIDSVLIP